MLSKHIHRMSRSDVRTLAWLVPLALVLMVWLMFRADPCLDDEIANYWPTPGSPTIEAPASSAGASDAIVVENPYGMIACDYWPSALDTTITFAILGFIALFVGFLCARNFQQGATIRAAVITFVTLSLALTFAQLVYLPSNRSFFEQEGYRPLMHAALYLLLLAVGAGVTSWLAALLTLRWFPRG